MYLLPAHPLNWGAITVAALLALVLEMAIVLFIREIDRRHCNEAIVIIRSAAHDNAALVLFSAAFLTVTVASGVMGDFHWYLIEWRTVLTTNTPWGDPQIYPFNAYGPLFNLLAFPAWINPLANKLLFASCYAVFVVWLIKDVAPRRGFNVLSSWPWMAFWFLNPFPWEQIAYGGHFDILFSLASVAAVHAMRVRKDRIAGTSLAIGVLLKYIPIILFPFLALSQRRLHFRFAGVFVAVVILGLGLSAALWGQSTFRPLMFAAARQPDWSIYVVLSSPHSPLGTFLADPSHVEWIEKLLLLAAGLGILLLSYVQRMDQIRSSVLATLAILLTYRVGYPHYQTIVFLLIGYWAASNWDAFKTRSVLVVLVFAYFGYLAFEDFALYNFEFFSFHIRSWLLCQFLLGCALLIGLFRFQPVGIGLDQA